MANGEVIEVESDDGDDDDEGIPVPSRANLITLCQQLEYDCMHYGDPKVSLELSQQLLKFRGILQREELVNSTQTSLDDYFR